MSDPLYLSLWFSDFTGPAMLPHMLAVLQQFPFSEQRPGITYVAVQPVSWNEPSILERRYSPGVAPEEAVLIAADLIHDDYAYVFDAYWDLWTPDEKGQWLQVPEPGQIYCSGRGIRRRSPARVWTHPDRFRTRLVVHSGRRWKFTDENQARNSRERIETDRALEEGRDEYPGNIPASVE